MAKHIIEENIKTIGGKSIVGKGDIEISSAEVKVDNKTITLTENGELQLGKVGEGQMARVIDITDQELIFRDEFSKGQTSFSGSSIEINFEDGPYMHLSTALLQLFNETSTTGISPGFISLQGDGNAVEFGNGEINLAKSEEGITKGGITLSPLFLEIKNENGQVNHTFTFPTQAVNNSSTMVVSVNNQGADEKGNITLPATGGRDFEYEKFVRSFPPQRSVYKYDREKMGNTFGDLFLPIAKFIDYYLYDITVSLIDENGEVITTMNLPEGAEEKYASILPTEVDGKSFYIEFPS
ncbi:hypothetical protein [Myroides sp. TSA_177.3]|uniref:hypothetical protein n=1 Tax=Myroides sp. TSA_177.3 TaxID=3415650 RepID=UPI004045FA87